MNVHAQIIHYFGRNATFILKQSVRNMEFFREQIHPSAPGVFRDHGMMAAAFLFGIIEVEHSLFMYRLWIQTFLFSPFGEMIQIDRYFFLNINRLKLSTR